MPVGPKDFNNPDRVAAGTRAIGVGPGNFGAYTRDDLSDTIDVLPGGSTASGAGGGVVSKSLIASYGGNTDRVVSGTAATTANLKHIVRRSLVAGMDLDADIQAPMVGYRISTAITNLTPHRLRMSLEYNGVVVKCMWGANDYVDVSGGEAEILPTPIQPSAFGVAKIPDQATVWAKVERTYAAGAFPVYFTASGYTYSGGEGFVRGAVDAPSQLETAGPLTATNGWATGPSSVFGPLCLIGKSKTPKLGLAVLGASIEWGRDGAQILGSYAYRGAGLGARKRAMVNLAMSGELAGDFAANANDPRRAMLKYANAAYNGYGGNEFSSNVNSALTISRLANINTQLKAAGISRIAQGRLFVKSDSTDGWATTANQTPRTGFIQFRNDVDAAAAADANVKLVIDSTTALETGPNTSIWARQETTDGTHPLDAGHAASAVPFEAGLTQLEAMAA